MIYEHTNATQNPVERVGSTPTSGTIIVGSFGFLVDEGRIALGLGT